MNNKNPIDLLEESKVLFPNTSMYVVPLKVAEEAIMLASNSKTYEESITKLNTELKRLYTLVNKAEYYIDLELNDDKNSP